MTSSRPAPPSRCCRRSSASRGDAIAIGAAVVAVAALETWTELRARRAIAAMRALAAPVARLAGSGGTVRQIRQRTWCPAT